MITRKQPAPSRFSTYVALISFGIGSVFLILHLLFQSPLILHAGLAYIIIAIVVNSITLLYLIYLLFILRSDRETIVIRIMILLSNIPIVFLYLNIVSNINII
jgi:hypothetical protein